MVPEKDSPSYSATGGFSISYLITVISLSASWPFARLRIFPDYIEIRLLGFIPFRRIWKENITAINRFSIVPVLFEGVLIRKSHVIPFSWIIFLCFDSRRLVSELRVAGYPV